MNITADIKYIGVNDHQTDLFEGMYKVPNGMAYNSYIIIDEKIAVMDTVDEQFTEEWLTNLRQVLRNRKPDYLIVHHMEPDHSANIVHFMQQYPQAVLVASDKAFTIMKHFFGTEYAERRIVVSDQDVLSLGRHKLIFETALMVHWPEVIVTYDSTDKALFSADAFGKFGALDVMDDWVSEARRYYIGIVGKYGNSVQKLLEKIKNRDIQRICPLHGPVLSENLSYYIRLYHTWSCYQPEEEGIFIAYTSVYGNTKKAAILLAEQLEEKGCKVIVMDIARCDMAEAVAEAFRYSTLVLATTTYNTTVFPPMREFINWLTERNFRNRKIAFIENGSWAPVAAWQMKNMFEKSKGLQYTDVSVKIMSALDEESMKQLKMLADELAE